MSFGLYFPKAVKLVVILKSNEGTCPLGILTIEDRIAQQVVVLYQRFSKERSLAERMNGLLSMRHTTEMSFHVGRRVLFPIHV